MIRCRRTAGNQETSFPFRETNPMRFRLQSELQDPKENNSSRYEKQDK